MILMIQIFITETIVSSHSVSDFTSNGNNSISGLESETVGFNRENLMNTNDKQLRIILENLSNDLDNLRINQDNLRMNKLNNALTAESFFNDKNLNLTTLNRIRKALEVSTKQIGGSNNKNPNKAIILSFFIDYAQKIGWDVLKEKLLSKLSSSMETQD